MNVEIAPPNGFETNTGAFVRKAPSKGRAGRPALEGERYPSGKLKPADKREGGPAPAEIKRTFDRAIRDGREPLLGTSLGLLMMKGEITAPQLAAGTAYARLQGRYDRAMDIPGRFTMSPDYGVARSVSNGAPMSDLDSAAAKERHSKTLAFLAGAMRGAVAVADGAGGLKRLEGESARAVLSYDARRTANLMERVCVEDLACESYELGRLKTALDVLVPWFGVGAHKGG